MAAVRLLLLPIKLAIKRIFYGAAALGGLEIYLTSGTRQRDQILKNTFCFKENGQQISLYDLTEAAIKNARKHEELDPLDSFLSLVDFFVTPLNGFVEQIAIALDTTAAIVLYGLAAPLLLLALYIVVRLLKFLLISTLEDWRATKLRVDSSTKDIEITALKKQINKLSETRAEDLGNTTKKYIADLEHRVSILLEERENYLLRNNDRR